MVEKISGFFMQKGFLKVPIRESEVDVVYRLTKEGLYYVCMIDDTQGWLIEDRASRIMEYLQGLLSEKYKEYTSRVEGLLIAFTENPGETKAKLEGGFAYWMAYTPTKKLMIYEDQPDSFYDVKAVMEEFWKQIPILAQLSQLKILFSPMNFSLMGINILVFIVLSIIGSTEDTGFMLKVGAMQPHNVIENGKYFTLFTSMFLHFGVTHLLYNMISLMYLGKALEVAIGKWKYLVVYILTGLGASLTSLWWHVHAGELYVACAGASGAICGVAGALAVYMVKNRKQNKNFSFLRWAIFLALIAGQGFGESGVDNAAHLGGLATGMVIGLIMILIKGKGETKNG